MPNARVAFPVSKNRSARRVTAQFLNTAAQAAQKRSVPSPRN
jgi:hypothetical protein